MVYIANDCYDDNDTNALYQFSEEINTDIRHLHDGETYFVVVLHQLMCEVIGKSVHRHLGDSLPLKYAETAIE